MKFRDYIEANHVFTLEQMLAEVDLSKSSVQVTLKRAMDAQRLRRVRRSLYVSRAGTFAQKGVDAFELVATMDSSAVLSFHSALEAHGVAHNVSSTCRFRSARVRSSFQYEGMSYVPYALDPCVEGSAHSIARRSTGSGYDPRADGSRLPCLPRPLWRNRGGVDVAFAVSLR